MNIDILKEKLSYIQLDNMSYDITLLEYSASPDFSPPAEMDGNPKYMVTDFREALALVKPFYRIALTIHTSPNSDFQMEAWLPEETTWNRRTMTIGNSGSAMTVNHLALIGAAMDDFATFHCNLGTRDNLDRGINNPEIWKDFGWRATHLTTEIGKQIVNLLYEEPAHHHYFYGCSTGGQQGISAAEHFPKDYDGIACVAPAISRTWLHIYFVWNVQNLMYPDGTFVFTSEEVNRLSALTIAYYQSIDDGQPGDGFVTDSRLNESQMHELFETIEQADFLTDDQLRRLWNVYHGPINPHTGDRIYCGFPMGAESGFFGLNAVKIPGYTYEYLYPVRWMMGEAFDTFDIFAFDFDCDTAQASALDKELNGDTGQLSVFKAAGGKLLMTSGSMDAVVPAANITDYYHRVSQLQGGFGETQDFFRYFIVPGFSHSIKGGSTGTDYLGTADGNIPASADYIPVAYYDAGLVDAVMAWVEQGLAPDAIMATGFNQMKAGGILVPDVAAGTRFQRLVEFYPNDTGSMMY